MPFKFYTVPIHDDGSAAAAMNAFLASHKVLAVERRWVDQGSNSFWTFCVDYLEAAKGSSPNDRAATFKNKTDYKEILKPDEFIVYAKLRELRKQIAQEEAVPVYTIFTNEQLAKVVQARVASGADLQKIDGIGGARWEKYGRRVLDLLQHAWKNNGEAGGKPS